MSIIHMTEARFNDLVYLTLKKLFFEPCFGPGHCPRECDIRVCMNMSQPVMMEDSNGLSAAILLPNEIAPKSHDIFYDVDTDVVFNECKDYMEDHWFKQALPDNFSVDGKVWYDKEIVSIIMTVEESKCGVTNDNVVGN